MFHPSTVCMKKFLPLLFLLLSQQLFAGDFMHDIGIGFWSKLRNTRFATPTSYGPHLQYTPRYNFPIKDKMSVSLASPLAFGARFNPEEGNFFTMQVPATLLFNIGHAAYKKEGHYDVGGYLGTGFNYLFSVNEDRRQSHYGLMSLAGMRFYTHHHSIGVHLSYTRDFRFDNNFVGAGLFYTFGYFE